MWEPFTESARLAMVNATDEASRWNSIDTEHLLLGILATDSIGAHALSTAGITLAEARRAIEECQHQEHGAARTVEDFRQEKVFSPGAKRVIELAFEQARELRHNYIGTEHLVLGILQQNTAGQSRAITQICADAAAIEAEIKRLVATMPQESKESRPATAPTHGMSGSMWEPFAEDARQAVVYAQSAAMKLGVTFIGSEHILLGIMAVGSGVGWETLNSAGVQADAIEAIVRKYSVKTKAREAYLVFTPDSKRVIEAAFAAAYQMKESHIGTGHLLIGLLDGDNIERIFDELNINREQIKRSAIERLQSF